MQQTCRNSISFNAGMFPHEPVTKREVPLYHAFCGQTGSCRTELHQDFFGRTPLELAATGATGLVLATQTQPNQQITREDSFQLGLVFLVCHFISMIYCILQDRNVCSKLYVILLFVFFDVGVVEGFLLSPVEFLRSSEGPHHVAEERGSKCHRISELS